MRPCDDIKTRLTYQIEIKGCGRKEFVDDSKVPSKTIQDATLKTLRCKVGHRHPVILTNWLIVEHGDGCTKNFDEYCVVKID